MKKYLLIMGGVLCALSTYAQEVITLPSSFDESKMITKRRDEQGRYQPIYDDVPAPMPATPEHALQQAQSAGQPQRVFYRGVPSAPAARNEGRQNKATIPAQEPSTLPALRNEAQQNEEVIPAQKPSAPPTPERRIKRYRAIEKDYSMPKSTFSSSTLSNIADAPSSFSNSSMAETIKRFKKESTRFEECQEGEKGCRQYDVDDKGDVIW